MKADIHPTWHEEATVTCACGHTFTVGAAKPEIRVDICSNCHPFFTGKMKFIDTQGRVEKFKKKQEEGAKKSAALAEKKKKKQAKERQVREQKSLKDMLSSMR